MTATPTIVADLGGFDLLPWLFTSYMLASTVVTPLVGKLSDIYGRRVFILAGIAFFMLSSVACGLAPNMLFLVVARAIQGLGGGIIFAAVFTTIGDLFPPADRARYMGLFTGTFTLASILGPTLGGFLTDHGGWRWVFLVNVPVGLVALPAIARTLPSRRSGLQHQIDWIGAGLLTGASIMFLLALVWAGDKYSWGSSQIIGLIAASLALTGLFLKQETRHQEPVLPLSLFRNRTFLIANLAIFMLSIGAFGALSYLSIFVQIAMGESATASGVITTPQSFGLLFASVIGGQIISKTGRYKYQSLLGVLLVGAAMAFLSRVALDTPRWHISAMMVVMGLGVGSVMPVMSLAIQNAVPHHLLGVGSSASQFFRQIATVFGVAIFGALLATTFESDFRDRLSTETKTVLGEDLSAFYDPTLPLDRPAFAAASAGVTAQPGGEELLRGIVADQRESVAVAVRLLFGIGALTTIACAALLFLLREVPLRASYAPAADTAAQPAAGREVQPEAAGSS